MDPTLWATAPMMGVRSPAPLARGGNNNNVIIPADYDRLSGSTAFYGLTRVKVVKDES